MFVCTCFIQYFGFILRFFLLLFLRLSINLLIVKWHEVFGSTIILYFFSNKVNRNSHKSSTIQPKFRNHNESIKSNRCYAWNDDKQIFSRVCVCVWVSNKFSIPFAIVFCVSFSFYEFHSLFFRVGNSKYIEQTSLQTQKSIHQRK